MPNYSGSWTLQSQMQAQGASTWPVPIVYPYIEDVFSTYLYKGTSAAQTIVNGVNLSANGGMVWSKSRSNVVSNIVVDTVRGGTNALITNSTAANSADTGFHISSFNTTGYSLQGAGSGDNFSGYTYVSWTFREAPKFFDVVTYTGTGAVQNIAHNLGSVPGCVITKKTSGTSNWAVYHRGITSSETGAILLNTNAAFATSAAVWNNTAPTSTQFTVGTADATNISGQTYVAYLFAHDAGGFGLTGTDNVISCGSYTGNGATQTITLGFEPQWLLVKKSNATGYSWWIIDCMRGMPVSYGDLFLYSDVDFAESAPYEYFTPTATGFQALSNASDSGGNYIYIAIRRGPMKVPTLGTTVFVPYNTTSIAAASSGSLSTTALYNNGFVSDTVIQRNKSGTDGWYLGPRLAGQGYMKTETTAAEVISTAAYWDSNIGAWNYSASYGLYAYRRAPGFFDVVCYTGTGVARTVSHNLAAVPELMIVKKRSGAENWAVYNVALGTSGRVFLNSTQANDNGAAAFWNSTTPTTTVFTVGTGSTNDNTATYVNYLFATCPGVSKVGSYTGTGLGNMQQINCGFTTGARFVMIKRTDSTGDWYVWDSARGIVAGNDPYLLINSTAAEVTSTDYVDTLATGFEVSATAPAALNATGGTYIFLAIA